MSANSLNPTKILQINPSNRRIPFFLQIENSVGLKVAAALSEKKVFFGRFLKDIRFTGKLRSEAKAV